MITLTREEALWLRQFIDHHQYHYEEQSGSSCLGCGADSEEQGGINPPECESDCELKAMMAKLDELLFEPCPSCGEPKPIIEGQSICDKCFDRARPAIRISTPFIINRSNWPPWKPIFEQKEVEVPEDWSGTKSKPGEPYKPGARWRGQDRSYG